MARRVKTAAPAKAGQARTAGGKARRSKATATLSIKSQADGPLYEKVKTAIRERIAKGHWPVGHRLPTLRQLSGDLNMAYATVERGVRELVEEGLLQGRKRGGTIVAQPKRPQLQTIGILGSMTFKRMMENSRYGFTLLNLLQERVIESRRMVVYTHWERDQPLASVFNNLSLVDALLIFGPNQRGLEEINTVLQRGVPAVYLGLTASDDTPTVDSANTSDTCRAIQLLQAQGHERIVYVCHSFAADSLTNQQRIEGFRQAMKQSAVGFHPSQVIIAPTEEQAAKLLAVSPRPTAMFYGGAREFPQLYQALLGSPLEPGKQLAVCVYDDNLWNTLTPLGIAFLDIEQPLRQIADRAVDNVLGMLDDPDFHPGKIELPSAIVSVSPDGRRQRVDV